MDRDTDLVRQRFRTPPSCGILQLNPERRKVCLSGLEFLLDKCDCQSHSNNEEIFDC